MNLPVKIAVGVLAAAVLLGCGAVGFLVYGRHDESTTIRQVASWLPAARVDMTTISYGEYLSHVDAAKHFIAKQGPLNGASGVMTDDDRKAALDRVVRIAAVNELASQYKVVVTPLDIDHALEATIQQAGTSTSPADFNQYLRDVYDWSVDDFKHFILGPAMVEDEVKRAYITGGKTEDDFNKMLETQMGEPHTKRYLKF